MHLRLYNEQTDFIYIGKWISDERTHALWCANLLPYPMSEDELHRYLHEQNLAAYVYADEEDRPLGFCIYTVNEQDKSGFVRFIMVDNTSRGKGYGTDMLRQLLRYAYENTGVASVRLNVFDVNAAARKCYEKAGFTIVQETPDAFSYRDEIWGRYMMEHTLDRGKYDRT